MTKPDNQPALHGRATDTGVKLEGKARPILFSAPMVRALLAGTKTQTRRVVKPQPGPGQSPHFYRTAKIDWQVRNKFGVVISNEKQPYGQPGDLLWVREAWADTRQDIAGTPALYRADVDEDGRVPYLVAGSPFGGGVGHARPDRWRPSIHMPRWATRPVAWPDREAVARVLNALTVSTLEAFVHADSTDQREVAIRAAQQRAGDAILALSPSAGQVGEDG